MQSLADGSSPATSVVDHLVDGVTAVSIVTLVAYAIVFGFEEGFNAFFQIPADYVATSFLSVFHVLSLVVFTIVRDLVMAGLEFVALLFLLIVPSHVYARRAWLLALTTFVLYSFSNLLKPGMLLIAAVLACYALFFWTKNAAGSRPRLISRLGDNVAKTVFIFILLLTPLFYFGFRFAERQNPRLVLKDDGETWVVARVLNSEFVMVRLLERGKVAQGCIDQYPLRPYRLSRQFRIIKEDQAKNVEWQQFARPMGYCLFESEKLQFINPEVSSLIFMR